MDISNIIKGVFFGQAIGDALGLATEFMSKVEVQQHYPNGVNNYQDIIQDEHRVRWQAGDWTDDTDQWLCILESILEHNQIISTDIAIKFYNWMTNGGMGVGTTTYRVLSLPQYVEFPHKGAELVWKMKGKNIAPNGALMRNSIVCLFQYQELDQVLQNCETVAKLTHFDPRCIDSCKVMAHLIIGELKGNPIQLNDLATLLSEYDPRISEYILPLKYDISILMLDEPRSVGYTLKALAAGLWAYFYADSFEEGLKAVVMEGGDADTNGCIAGSMLGAKFGYDMIPQRLVTSLNQVDKLNEMLLGFLDQLNINELDH